MYVMLKPDSGFQCKNENNEGVSLNIYKMLLILVKSLLLEPKVKPVTALTSLLRF